MKGEGGLKSRLRGKLPFGDKHMPLVGSGVGIQLVQCGDCSLWVVVGSELQSPRMLGCGPILCWEHHRHADPTAEMLPVFEALGGISLCGSIIAKHPDPALSLQTSTANSMQGLCKENAGIAASHTIMGLALGAS